MYGEVAYGTAHRTCGLSVFIREYKIEKYSCSDNRSYRRAKNTDDLFSV